MLGTPQVEPPKFYGVRDPQRGGFLGKLVNDFPIMNYVIAR
jgi:hypothetical protein